MRRWPGIVIALAPLVPGCIVPNPYLVGDNAATGAEGGNGAGAGGGAGSTGYVSGGGDTAAAAGNPQTPRGGGAGDVAGGSPAGGGGRVPGAGGSSNGGQEKSGGVAGGTPTGGVAGGTPTGGIPVGGAPTGGGPTGGTALGGALTGGAPTGGAGGASGASTGGALTGGTLTGGADTGGGGGQATGGVNTGGATGGTETGGAETGGAATGGTDGQLTAGACTVGAGTQTGSGRTSDQYNGVDIQRDGRNYRMITNAWGQNWVSHDISWLGTSMTIHDFQGSHQSNGAPAGYPSVFCGKYSDASQECGLPRALSGLTALNTAASWAHPDGNGTYNVAYDVWLGDGNATFAGLQSYFMVWLRDPPGEQPVGTLDTQGVEVANVSGSWDIVTGQVNNLPIVSYVRAEGDDAHAMAFDIMDFILDAQTRGLQFPGTDVLSIAIGFEIWDGPVTDLSLDDFCLDIR